MATTSTAYTARFSVPDLIERSRTNVLRAPVYRDGGLVAPSAGLVSVYQPSGTALVANEAATITDKVATYTLASSAVPATMPLGAGWRIEWVLTIDGVEVQVENDGALVRKVLRPVISDVDLFRRCSGLDPNGPDPMSTLTNYQPYIDEAWVVITLRLLEQGNRPNLIMSPSALREVHASLTLSLLFEDHATRLNAAFSDRAKEYRGQYETAWGRLNFVYDKDGDGTTDPNQRKAGPAITWLSGRGR